MKVLIAGGYNVFVSQLIEKFHKEGWEVYLLTGSKKPSRRHAYVFEQYDFSYNSDSIKEIIDSASPDLVVFAGAYDSNFSAKCTRQESMYYMSGLVNILMASQMLRVSSFVYISSHEVYEESYSAPVDEEQPASPVSTRGLLISQGEELVQRYGGTTDMDTLILRLDHLYWVPRNRAEVSELHAQMCLDALRRQEVPASSKNIFSSIFISDAVYAAYEIINRGEHEHMIYNITTGEEENELEIAQIIRESAGDQVVIKDNTFDPVQRNVMSGQRVREEFGVEPRHSYKERVAHIMQYMKINQREFLLREEREETWFEKLQRRFERTAMALLPFLENGIVFLFVFLLNNRTADSEYFRRLDVFLLYVVLFAVFYGKRQAILAAFLASLGFIFRQSYYRTGVEVLVDYNIYIWMAQLFIVGMAVGHLRDSIKMITDDKDEQIEFLTGQLDDIYDINNSNLKVKNILEDHIIAYEDSLGVLQNLTQSLEKLNPGEALYEAVGVLSQVMETKDVAIYKVSNGDYCRLLVATTEDARGLGKSLKYSAQEDLAKSLAGREVFVNRAMEPKLPVMAYGLYHAESLEYIVMVWNLSFEKMSLHQMNLLKVVGNMIQNAIARSDVYLEALSEKRYVNNTAILNEEAFSERLQTDKELSDKDYAKSTLLCVQSAGPAQELLQDTDELEDLSDTLVKNLRETDTVGIGEDGYFYILLSNSSDQDAQIVIRRFADHGIQCSLGPMPKQDPATAAAIAAAANKAADARSGKFRTAASQRAAAAARLRHRRMQNRGKALNVVMSPARRLYSFFGGSKKVSGSDCQDA